MLVPWRSQAHASGLHEAMAEGKATLPEPKAAAAETEKRFGKIVEFSVD